MERIAIDIVGPLERSNKGNRYICVVQDYFTKWAEAFAIKNQEASTIGRKLVKNVFVRFGIPKIIHTDQGANFESKLFHDICSLMDIKKTRTCPYNPKSDGMVERLNRTIIDMLSKCANTHSNWDELLPLVMMAYRSATHSATKYTPNFLMLGKEICTPLDMVFDNKKTVINLDNYAKSLKMDLKMAHKLAYENMKIQLEKTKVRYNKSAYGKPYNIGDKVWVIINVRKNKLDPYYEGPYVVKQRISNSIYRLDRNGKPLVTNFDKLKPYVERTPKASLSRNNVVLNLVKKGE